MPGNADKSYFFTLVSYFLLQFNCSSLFFRMLSTLAA